MYTITCNTFAHIPRTQFPFKIVNVKLDRREIIISYVTTQPYSNTSCVLAVFCI